MMKIIDAHLHFSNLETFHETASDRSHLLYSSAGLTREFAEAHVVFGIGMGLVETAPGGSPDSRALNPMTLDLEPTLPLQLASCAGINPIRLSGDERQGEMMRIEAELQKPTTVGLKIYAGYFHFYVFDEVYQPVYDLAAKYNLPVVIHSGDTYSPRGLLKYSHPLTVDELAVQRRDVNFVIAHFGDPWIMDTAEVLNKNWNVYADLSGLIVGDAERVASMRSKRLFMEHFQRGLVYLDNYEKVLFGTDWPLTPIAPYVEFVKDLVPAEAYEDVFYRNALRVFPRLKALVGE